MGAQLYEKRVQVNAIEFQGYPPTDPLHMNDIMAFVQVPVSMEFNPLGAIQLRVVLNNYNVLIVQVGDYIVRDAKGNVTQMKKAAFDAEYTKVTE